MDKADAAGERVNTDDGLRAPFPESTLGTIIPFPREQFSVASNLLNDELERFNSGLPLTRAARDFLKEAITPLLAQIPGEADLFEFKKRIAEFIKMAFRILIAAGILGVPKDLPKREKPIADTVILRTENKRSNFPSEEPLKNTQLSHTERLVAQIRLFIEFFRFRMGLLASRETCSNHARFEEIRFQLELVLADCLFLDKTLEREGDRFRNVSNRGQAFIMGKELDRVTELFEGAETSAQKLRDEKPATKRILIKGARTYTAIHRAEQIAADFECAREKAHFMMVQERSTAKTPPVLQTKVPTNVDRRIVIDLVAPKDRQDALHRSTALISRQINVPVPLDEFTESLCEWSIEKLPYPFTDIDPLIAIHEVVRRATSDATCTRPEILQQDLLRTVFHKGRPLFTKVTRPKKVRVSDIECVSEGPLKGQKETTIDKIVGFEPWMPN